MESRIPDCQSTVCLDVVIDHRIRRLFKPVQATLEARSEHVSRIEERGQSMGRSSEEIQVTAQLAGPARKGGIAIALQQPRHNHPFERGLDAVIKDCETLRALDESFTTVSSGTLDVRTDITVVDLLPYVSGNVADVDNDILRESFEASKQVICDKNPTVLLCAGKVRMPEEKKFDNVKGDTWRIESIGLGKKFGSTPKLSARVRLRSKDRCFVSFTRVNCFHRSYAMNYQPHASLLRQLLILIVVEACGELGGAWKNEQWMDGLRSQCQEIPKLSLDQISLPGYQQLYSDALHVLRKSAESIILESMTAGKSPEALYKILLSKGLSTTCNDAALILCQMFRLQQRVRRGDIAWSDQEALDETATDTIRCVNDLRKAMKQDSNERIVTTVQENVHCILECIEERGYTKFELDLDRAHIAFLGFASDIETLLSNLLSEEKETINDLRQEEELLSKMGEMSLVAQL